MVCLNSRMDEEKDEEKDKMSRPIKPHKRKYTWCDGGFDEWCKKEAEKLRDVGIQIDTAGVTRMLHQRVLTPNNVTLTEIIVPTVKINKKWKKVL